MDGQGSMAVVPAALRDRGETLALADGRALYVPRWSARKAFQVAKFLSGMFEGIPAEKLAAFKSGNPLAIAQALIDVAEEKAFALADLCLGKQKPEGLDLTELDWGDFTALLAAIARVNLTEGDRKNLSGLVPWLQKPGAGPSTSPSSPPSAG